MANYRGVPEVLCCLFHLFAFSVYTFALGYEYLYIKLPHRFTFAGRLKFLTYWNELVQVIFFGYSVLNDLFGSNLKSWDDPSHRSKLQKIRDFVASSIVFPLGMFVVLSFWTIYTIDRELIYPKILDTLIPSWDNHVMHTTSIPFLLVEKYFVYHHYPMRSKGLTAGIVFCLSYIGWILWLAYSMDFWVYPFLAVFNWPSRIMFLSCCLPVVNIFYVVGEKITNSIWKPTKQILIDKAD